MRRAISRGKVVEGDDKRMVAVINIKATKGRRELINGEK